MRRTSTPGMALLGLLAAGLALGLPATGHAKPYKGGELYSSQAYRYGRIEVRMRMARGSGLLSTFFTYKNGSEVAGTFWEEIDIEVFGKENAVGWQSNIITGQGTRTTSEEVHTHPFSLADAYHTYTLEWTPDYVAWALDGVEVRRTTGGQVEDLTNPQSLRFNIWIAEATDWVGPFDPAVLPQYQYVNWISYSRYEGGQFVHEWRDDFDSLDGGRWARANWTFAENLADFDPNNVVVRDGTLVLALTREGATGFNGTVPPDDGGSAGGTGGTTGSGGSDTGGTASGGTAGSGGPDTGGTASGGVAGSGGAGDGGNLGGVAGSGGVALGGGETGGTAGSGGSGVGGVGPGGSGSGGTAGSGGAGVGGLASSGGSGVGGGGSSSGGAGVGGGLGGVGGSGGAVAGVGGAVPSGGAVGTGGSSPPTPSGASGSTAVPAVPSADDGGCSCRLGPRGSGSHAGWSLGWVGLAWLVGRRRRGPARARDEAAKWFR